MEHNLNKWFEVWYVDGEGVIPHHFLIVVSGSAPNKEILVIDPLNNNKVNFCSMDYEKIVEWLTEDEYCLVRGREYFNDGLS
jgi:hypothetical protein